MSSPIHCNLIIMPAQELSNGIDAAAESLSNTEALQRISLSVLDLFSDEAISKTGPCFRLPTKSVVLGVNQTGIPVLKSDDKILRKRCVFALSKHTKNQFQSICKILHFCCSLLRSNRTATIRQIYYMHNANSIFSTYAKCTKAVNDVISLTKIRRHSLGITSTAKGLFAGCVELQVEQGRWGISVGNNATPIECSIAFSSDVKVRSSHQNPAKAIIIVEKDTVFQHMLQSNFFRKFPCIYYFFFNFEFNFFLRNFVPNKFYKKKYCFTIHV